MAKKRSGQGGFTLIELLIVIVILGILAAIVVLAIGGLKGSSQTAACNSEMKTIGTAEDAYFASTGQGQAYAWGSATTPTYPANAPVLWATGTPANLLKSDPTADFTVKATATPGYTITGIGRCTGLTDGYPTANG
jgi:prepilin-type N-terminal cleavage/methylation domain-containing protein